jgi:exportin-1
VVKAEPNHTRRDKLLAELMALPNQAVSSLISISLVLDLWLSQWDALMQQAATATDSMSIFANMDNVKLLLNVLKTNVAVCTSVGPHFTSQLGKIFMDMLGLYRAVSRLIGEFIKTGGCLYLQLRLWI